MFNIFSGIRSLLKLETVSIDNNIFRLHYKLTMITLMAFSIINTSRQYIGDPIECIADGVSSQVINTYCWITGTFTVPSKQGRVDADIAHLGVSDYVEGQDEVIVHKYYQWVCFLLFFQAILFYVPRYLWKSFEGGRVRSLVSDLKLISLSPEAMDSKCHQLRSYFKNNITYHTWYYFKFICCEVLNLVNVVGQMFLMDYFLQYEFSTYGVEVVNFSELEGFDRIDPMSRVFPKMTKCTFHKYGPSGTIQSIDSLCVLPLNIVNEKIYIVLWFWFIILAGLTLLGLVYRVAVLLSPSLRYFMLKSHMKLAPETDLKLICKVFHVGDWFMFYQIAYNVNSFALNKVVRDVAKDLIESKYKNSEVSFTADKGKQYELLNTKESV